MGGERFSFVSHHDLTYCHVIGDIPAAVCVYLIHAAHKMVMQPIPFLAVIPQSTR